MLLRCRDCQALASADEPACPFCGGSLVLRPRCSLWNEIGLQALLAAWLLLLRWLWH